jgi:hypothetical protein
MVLIFETATKTDQKFIGGEKNETGTPTELLGYKAGFITHPTCRPARLVCESRHQDLQNRVENDAVTLPQLTRYDFPPDDGLRIAGLWTGHQPGSGLSARVPWVLSQIYFGDRF